MAQMVKNLPALWETQKSGTASLVAQRLKGLPPMRENWVRSLGREDPLKKAMATHSSILGLPGGSDGKESACIAGDLGSIPGLGRSPGEGNGKPLQYSCLENPMDGGAWWATVHGVAKIRTRLSDFTLGPYYFFPWRNVLTLSLHINLRILSPNLKSPVTFILTTKRFAPLLHQSADNA